MGVLLTGGRRRGVRIGEGLEKGVAVLLRRLQTPRFRRTLGLRFRAVLPGDGTEGWNWAEPEFACGVFSEVPLVEWAPPW